MAVVVWITEMYPKHGVLAVGNVTINSEKKLMGVELIRQTNRHNYKVTIPKSAGAIDSDLREKIIDAMTSKYEQSSRFHQGGRGSEQTVLGNKHRKNLRFEAANSYHIRNYY
jgi:dUTPase